MPKPAYDLEKRIRKAMKSLPKLVAEEAAEYSRRRFAEKNFDGKPWKPLSPHYHPTRGTLLVRSGALLNSVRVVSTSQEKVVIGAGNSKVKYAKAHNEGFSGSVVVKSFRRIGKNGKIHNVRSHTRKMNIPQRQFMGHCGELERLLKEEAEKLFKNVMK